MTIENTITIPLSTLRAISLFAADQDVRYFLNGIYIDPEGVFVATNGHQMITHELGVKSPLPPTILPIAAVRAAIKAGRSACTATIPADNVTIVANPNQLIVHTRSGDVSLPYQPIDGTFADWRRIAQSAKDAAKKAQGERSICFHWPYLNDCQTAFDLIVKGKPCPLEKGATAVQLTLTGNASAIATYAAASTTCYVMPKRT